jgi:phospholipase C
VSSPIKNIVVVMLENRSYDNVLGWLYNGSNQPPYRTAPSGQHNLQGLTGTETNPGPGGTTVSISNAAATTVPAVDPGELFSDMAQQIYGTVETTNPYGNPPAQADAMQGFVNNYSGQPGVQDVGDCMTYLTPDQAPVSAWLANNFAVCDQWYASVPCQTFTNRVFAVCGAPAVGQTMIFGKPLGGPYSMVDDLQYAAINAVWLETPVIKTAKYIVLPCVYQALDYYFGTSDIPNWKVYFSDYSIAALTVPYVYQAAISSSNVNVATYDNSDWSVGSYPIPALIGDPLGAVPSTFVEDVAQGTLPALSFIEPRYAADVAESSLEPNCNHPGNSKLTSLLPGPDSPIDVANGEAFLAEIYNLLRASRYWDQTLLIITYDEHGGVYDHMPPVGMTPPGAAITPGGGTPPIPIPVANDITDSTADGFRFNYSGCRVPAIIVSPYIEAGTTIAPCGSVPFDHTSIIRTAWDIFGLPSGESLTQRDLNAPSLNSHLTSTPANTTGQYSGPLSAARPTTAAAQPPNAGAKTPEERQALFNARLDKSKRGGGASA